MYGAGLRPSVGDAATVLLASLSLLTRRAASRAQAHAARGGAGFLYEYGRPAGAARARVNRDSRNELMELHATQKVCHRRAAPSAARRDRAIECPRMNVGVQHGKAAELSTACAARGRGAPRGGGAWLAARVQTGEKRGRNGGLSTP